MKSLFSEDKHESFTAEAMDLDRRIGAALSPIVDDAVKQGYSLRDVHYIINMTALDLCLSQLIGWNDPPQHMKPNREGIWEWFEEDGTKRLVHVCDVAKDLRQENPDEKPYFRVYWWGGYYNINDEEVGTSHEQCTKAEWPDRWGNFVGEIGSVKDEDLYLFPTPEQMKKIPSAIGEG